MFSVEAVEERNEMLGLDWSEAQDEEGNYFFYNSKTQESTWEPPKVDFRVSKEEKARLAKEAAKEAEKAERRAQKAAAQAAKRKFLCFCLFVCSFVCLLVCHPIVLTCN